MYCGHQRLAKCVQTSTKRGEDAVAVARLESAVDKVDWCDVLVLGTRVAISDTARDLSVVIDRELSLAANATAVCLSGYNQLRQLRPVVRSLSMNATMTLVKAFISCRLDYCNSLLYGISDGLIQRLQSVQNAGARLVTGARGTDHITPVLRQLHWLPVCQQVAFKIAGLVHQSLAGAAPAYLADDSSSVWRWSSSAEVSFQRHSCSCHKDTTNLATGVSRQPVLDCGTIFHPDCGGWVFPSILSDDLWKHISLATEAPSESFDL